MAAKKKIKVVVNPALSAWGKDASYKGKRYSTDDGELELPEDCLFYRTSHFGSVVPSFRLAEAVASEKPVDNTVLEN